jgi:ribulose-phosphate 3-epimerase
MRKAAPGWLDALPADRLLAEMSLWSADLGRMSDEIARVDAFTDLYHLDVADGHFSPDLLLFPDMARMVRRQTARPLHVHLMVADDILADQIRQFADAGADAISIHAENAGVDGALSLIAGLQMVPGLVLQLHTPVADVARYIDRLGILTLLGTRIGIKGKDLDGAATRRLGEARDLIARTGPRRRVLLASDGGNRAHTVPLLRAAGAETIVLGSLAFDDPDLPARMAWLHGLGPKD